MKLYNTLGRKIQEFVPSDNSGVKLYTCGPTVYDAQTIGNLRTYVFYDTLKRTLVANGLKVEHVMNITDVGHLTSDADEGEDKLEKGAAKSGKSVWEVADYYIEQFKSDLMQMNVGLPKIYRATDFIKQQIEMVKVLLDKDFAYQTEQAIYFDITKLDDYGQLTGQKLSEKEIAARSEVVTDSHKKSPQDFALWFFTVGRYAEHTMRWDSPWGEGFPGWHLECSAIIHATLGDPIDIHAGAVDLIGTHHTNEIAQTEAAYGNHLSKYWLHAEHLLVENQKMSKSKNNFYTLKDITKKGYDPIALRLLYLQAHYRSQLNFTWKSLAAASQNLKNLQAWADQVFQPVEEFKNAKVLLEEFNKFLADDLNTPMALAKLNQSMALGAPSKHLLQAIDSLLGLQLSERSDLNDKQKGLIASRQKARESKDWQKADKLRDELLEQGIELNDTSSGVVWSRAS